MPLEGIPAWGVKPFFDLSLMKTKSFSEIYNALTWLEATHGQREVKIMMSQCRKILVIEDNELVGDMIADMISMAGHSAIGPVDSEVSALSVLDEQAHQIDLAVLDFHLAGSSELIAGQLAAKGIPFIWATGAGEDIPHEYDNPVCLKPFTRTQLMHSLKEAFAAA